jgi:class 3 adenylate cyclase
VGRASKSALRSWGAKMRTPRHAAGGVLIPEPETAGWALKRKYFLRELEETTIGRSTNAHVQIVGHPEVSREHACIYPSENGYMLEHRSEKSPTSVLRSEKEHILDTTEPFELRDGDIVQLANDEVRLRIRLFDVDEVGTQANIVAFPELRAILHADVVGYTHHTEVDPLATGEKRKICRRIFKNEYHRHRGILLEDPGDSILLVFSSVKDAVSCAKAVQQRLAEYNQSFSDSEQMEFRMGIDAGDTYEIAREICGEAVNIAKRVQETAEPGDVWISRVVYDLAASSERLEFERVETSKFKNVSREIDVYRLIKKY